MTLEKSQSNKHDDSLVVLIDLIPDPVIVIDCLGKIVAANKIIGKFAGYEKEALIGKSFRGLGFISEDYKLLLPKKADKKFVASIIEPYEVKIKTKSGEVKCLKVNGNRLINKGELLNLVIFHDVSEENKTRNKLRQGLFESEEKFRVITNSIREALIVVNDEAKVTYWNPAAEKIFDYTNEEAIGKDIHELVVPKSMCKEGRERIALSVKTFTQTGMGYFTVGNVELVGRRKDGSEFPIRVINFPYKV